MQSFPGSGGSRPVHAAVWAGLAALAMTAGPSAHAAHYTTFDAVEGASSTAPYDIADDGTVVGTFEYLGVFHGFRRDRRGRVTVIDPPRSTATYPLQINRHGLVAGTYYIGNDGGHGFTMKPDGQYEAFDPDGALVTHVTGVAANGDVGGYFITATGARAFLRSGHVLVPFDVSGATYTTLGGMNSRGDATGWFMSPEGVATGYIRTSAGSFTTFAFDGATSTYPGAIDDAGVVTGIDVVDSVDGAFVRKQDGTLVPIDPEGSERTLPSAVGKGGEVVGLFLDANQLEHGFVRKPGGKIEVEDYPGASQTSITGINRSRATTGLWYDPRFVVHGYIRTR